jgi:hypothetical protein
VSLRRVASVSDLAARPVIVGAIKRRPRRGRR